MGITTALTPQWVVSSSSPCSNFWLLLPLSPSSPARPRPTPATWPMLQLCTTPTPTGPEWAPQESAPPATAAGPDTSMARGALRLSPRLMPTTVTPTDTPDTVLATEPTATDLPATPSVR